jgi:hypothetical protein
MKPEIPNSEAGSPGAEPRRRISLPRWLVPTSEEAARLATVLQLFVVMISLLFIWLQVKQQTRSLEQQGQSLRQQAESIEQQAKSMKLQVDLTKAASTQALANMVLPMGVELWKSGELMQLTLNGAKGFPGKVPANKVREERYKTYLATSLIFYENMYTQHDHQLLDDDIYAGWVNDLKTFVDEEAIEKYWDKWKVSYTGKFGQLVTTFVEEKRGKTQPGQ